MFDSLSVAEGRDERAYFCARCGHPIAVADAHFCNLCGARLAHEWLVRARNWNPFAAALLSIVPGLGHLYRGHPWRAAAWFLGVMLAYGASRPLGLLLHLVCGGNAALADGWSRGQGQRA